MGVHIYMCRGCVFSHLIDFFVHSFFDVEFISLVLRVRAVVSRQYDFLVCMLEKNTSCLQD